MILRKNSFGNRSAQGADVQAILMSTFFTLKKRGHNPVHTVREALTAYLKTGQLPPLIGPLPLPRERIISKTRARKQVTHKADNMHT